MSGENFYRKRLIPDIGGLVVVTDTFVSIHETPCFHFCVAEFRARMINILKKPEESAIQYCRRTKILKKISKDSSRIAFKTEEQALKHLRFLKVRQLGHLTRDKAFVEKFLATKDEDLKKNCRGLAVPDSKELVNEFFVFEE